MLFRSRIVILFTRIKFLVRLVQYSRISLLSRQMVTIGTPTNFLVERGRAFADTVSLGEDCDPVYTDQIFAEVGTVFPDIVSLSRDGYNRQIYQVVGGDGYAFPTRCSSDLGL